MAHLQELLNKTDFYKDIIASASYDKKAAHDLNDYFRSEIIFNSNSLDGSSITLSETRSILEGNTSKDRKTPLSDVSFYAVTGFNRAYEYMLELSKQDDLTITDEIVRKMHLLFYQNTNPVLAGNYRTKKIPASTCGHCPPEPDDLPRLMSHLGDQILSSQTTLYPVELAAMAHKRLVDICPFDAGNLQIAMLLMNLILIRSGYCTVIIPASRRADYQNALSASRKSIDMNPFSILIAECIIESCMEYCRLLDM